MPDSAVITLMRQFKASLLAGERAQTQAMASAWLKVERRLSSQMDALAYEMGMLKRDGGTVTQEMLMTNVRYRELLVQLTDELEGYTGYAERTTLDRQRQLARLGIDHGAKSVQVQSVRAAFNRLPIEAVEHLIGLAGDGSPLRSLLAASWPLSAHGMTQELINGVALGYNPRKTAKLMAQGAQGSLQRMMVIARSEQLRAYKSANLASYIASGVVESYLRLATHDRRVCFQCIALEGTEYPLDEMMPSHPQCRCTLVPKVKGIPTPKWQAGEAWLVEQDPAWQRDILGKGRYYAWQNGDAELEDFVQIVPNAIWGDTLRATPMRELVSAQGVL